MPTPRRASVSDTLLGAAQEWTDDVAAGLNAAEKRTRDAIHARSRRGFAFGAPPLPPNPQPTPRRAPVSPSTAGGASRSGGVDPQVRRHIDNLLVMGSGWGPGARRGALESARGIADAAIVGARLFDPTDPFRKPKGASAWDQLFDGTADTLYGVGGAVRHPAKTARAVYDRVVPDVSTPGLTAAEERRRYYEAGVNQGEFAFGAMALGGAAAPRAVIAKLDRLRPQPGPEKYIRQGFNPSEAAYLALPYTRPGHHFMPKRTKIPKWLGGGEVPKRAMESAYNRLAPEGMTRGDFYELHYYVDPDYSGGGLRRTDEHTWSGAKLGLRKGTLPERILFGSPTPLKARVLGIPATLGGAVHDDHQMETAR